MERRRGRDFTVTEFNDVNGNRTEFNSRNALPSPRILKRFTMMMMIRCLGQLILVCQDSWLERRSWTMRMSVVRCPQRGQNSMAERLRTEGHRSSFNFPPFFWGNSSQTILQQDSVICIALTIIVVNQRGKDKLRGKKKLLKTRKAKSPRILAVILIKVDKCLLFFFCRLRVSQHIWQDEAEVSLLLF